MVHFVGILSVYKVQQTHSRIRKLHRKMLLSLQTLQVTYAVYVFESNLGMVVPVNINQAKGKLPKVGTANYVSVDESNSNSIIEDWIHW